MKRKKWILPVCITCSFVVLCLVAVFVIAYVMSVQGYGISTGRLYFDDNYTFLIDENDRAMIVSDCSKDKKMYEGYQSGDKVLIIHDGVETSYPSRTGGYHIFRLSKGDGSYKPADEVLGISTYVQIGWTVLLDGVNPLTQPETVQHSRGYANISLTIPDGWEYYAEDSGDENDFCIAFWPEGQTEGKIKVWYYDSFGVCGTGLEEEKITIGEYEAYQGTYDNRKTWNFISFLGMPGSYVVLNMKEKILMKSMENDDKIKIGRCAIMKKVLLAIVTSSLWDL